MTNYLYGILCNQRDYFTRCQQQRASRSGNSQTLMKTCRDAEDQRTVVTLFLFLINWAGLIAGGG